MFIYSFYKKDHYIQYIFTRISSKNTYSLSLFHNDNCYNRINTHVCISYFSIALIKHYDQVDL